MEKEIHEIPAVIRRIAKEYRGFDFSAIRKLFAQNATIHIAACGTSYHAGLMMAALLESHVKRRAKVYIASEFPFLSPLVNQNDVGIVISQSGETADTLAAMQTMQEYKMPIIAICNVAESSITRKANFSLLTHAGTEVAIASTKAFVAQVLVAGLLTGYNSVDEFEEIAIEAEKILESAPEIKKIATRHKDSKRTFFLGKGLDAISALEAALKVKETTYKHCEGYPSGELKHGTLSLVDENTLTISINTPDIVPERDKNKQAKLQNTITQVRDRGSQLWLPAPIKSYALGTMPAQLFALYTSQALGLNPDQPRNLVKAVMVE